MSDTTREAAEVAIDVLLQEKREFLPSPEFVRGAVVSDPAVYDEADRDLDGFWLDAHAGVPDVVASRPPRGSSGTPRTAPGSPTAR